MKRLLQIASLLCFCLLVRAEVWTDVVCGDWITIKAHPMEDYVFVKWSDDNTDSVRSIQVNEDAVYTAYFAARCEDYANWPVIEVQDGMFCIDITTIEALGYYISPLNVTWYRVVNEPDDMHDVFPLDDQVVEQGSYYLTLTNTPGAYGSYYATVDVSDAQGMLCSGLMRTVIISYSGGIATGITDMPQMDNAVRKIIIDNTIYILRGDKLYTIQGHEVK